jgi:tRNA(Ile)-lysidine synthase
LITLASVKNLNKVFKDITPLAALSFLVMQRLKFNSRQFVRHVQNFMENMSLMNSHKSVLVAVSGGVDSVALMYVLNEITQGKLKVLHINHGTRPENAQEEALVLAHAKKLNIEVDVVKFSLNLQQSNFEGVARNLRAEVYKQYLQKNFWVYTAHHLDDSFEWSMIQSFKQSQLQSTLGIPVFNKGLVRPFMCVSKNHIRKYAASLGLDYAEDGSNRDLRFERNFFRSELTQTIHERYPQYLRHYVTRQTALALKLNLHRSLLKEKIKKPSLLIEKREASGAVVLKSSDFSFHKAEIKEWIHFFSKSHRGEIDREVDKLIAAHKDIKENSHKLKMKGPLSYSGGVKIFLLDDFLLITNDTHLEYYLECDKRFLQFLKANVTQITSGKLKYESVKKNIFFPYLMLLRSEDKDKSSKLVHPLMPMSIQWLKDHNISYNFYPLLTKKNRQMLRLHAVILDSSILGL